MQKRVLTVLAVLVGISNALAAEGWPHWGGPHGDFSVSGVTLGPWPEAGPRELWRRDVSGGYASIVVRDGTAYVVARTGDDERLLALDAKSGVTKWEYSDPAPVPQPQLTDEEKSNPERERKPDEYVADFGFGPNATPLLLNDRIITIGFMGDVNCVSLDGRLLWKRDLIDEFKLNFLRFGYSASPIAYGDAVLLFGGGPGAGVVALNPHDGSVIWQKQDLPASYASPMITTIGGRDVLVAHTQGKISALNPANGELWWSMEHANQFGSNIATPLACPDDCVYVGTKGQKGSVLLHFKWDGDKLLGETRWTSDLGLGHQNAVLVGDRLIATLSRPEAIAAVNLTTGDYAWRDRQHGFATLVRIGDECLALTDDGKLEILKPGAEAAEIRASKQILSDPSWTAPTVVGNVAYLRDRKSVVAVEIATR